MAAGGAAESAEEPVLADDVEDRGVPATAVPSDALVDKAVLDRALADPDWVAARLEELRTQGPTRTKGGGRLQRSTVSPLEVACRSTESEKAADDLERQMFIELADSAPWNRARPRT